MIRVTGVHSQKYIAGKTLRVNVKALTLDLCEGGATDFVLTERTVASTERSKRGSDTARS